MSERELFDAMRERGRRERGARDSASSRRRKRKGREDFFLFLLRPSVFFSERRRSAWQRRIDKDGIDFRRLRAPQYFARKLLKITFRS